MSNEEAPAKRARMTELASLVWSMTNYLQPITVAFTGHRPVKLLPTQQQEVQEWLRTSIFEPLHKYIDVWVCGGALGVDAWAADLVMEHKGYLHLDLPFQQMEKHWEYEDRKRLQTHRQYARDHGHLEDNVLNYYGPKTYFDRDKSMVDKCDILVAVLNNDIKGGTKITVDYAKQQNANSNKHLIKRYNPVNKEENEYYV